MDRNISATLTRGPPWGFRLKGGEGTGSAIIIARVNKNSPAYRAGVKEGDHVTSVNGHSTDNLSHAAVQQMIRNSGECLSLQVQRSCTESDPTWQPSTEHGNLCSNDLPPADDNLALPDECEDEMKFTPDLVSSTGLDISNSLSSSATSSTSTCSTTIFVNCGQLVDASPSDSNQNFPDDTPASESDTQRVWSPGQLPTQAEEVKEHSKAATEETIEEVSPVWQPFGGPIDAPQFRKIKLEMPSTPPPPERQPETTVTCNNVPETTQEEVSVASIEDSTSKTSVSTQDGTISPPVSLSPSSSTTFTKTGRSSNLPPSQSPTITLLQKAREGQIPKGAVYIDDKENSRAPLLPKNAVLIDQKVTVEGDKVHTDSYYAIPTQEVSSSSTIVKAPKYDGIGPTEYGIPIGLRTSVKDEYGSDWYRTMYRTLHRAASEGGHTVHQGGYMSEPEFDRNDSYYHRAKYATVDFRKKPERVLSHQPEQHTLPKIYKTTETTNVLLPSHAHSPHEPYKNQPRSIAEYEPGHSSIADKEFQKFWDDFWDSVGDLQQHLHHSPRKQLPVERKWPNSIFSDGYESDSTLIRKTGKVHRLDPQQQKAWYREVQKGGEIPFTGLGKLAPEKPKEPLIGPSPPVPGSKELDATHPNRSASPHQYQESEVNIHYRSPIRNLEKEYIEEEELRKRQEEAMKKFYEEEKYRKHLQHLAEIEMRRHCDFYTQSQKSPIPLNRYDNPFDTEVSPVNKTPEPRTLARAMFGFTAQTSRELGFSKGDIIYINKKIDKNWYEGEHHGQIGIFPVNYVEIIPFENANLQPRKAAEGLAMVKYNFRAQTPMELSLFKGETVILIKRVDQNWYEGRIGTKKGIFPSSYVNVASEPGEYFGNKNISPKPPTSQAFSSVVNGAPQKILQSSPLNTGISTMPQKFVGRDIAFAKTEEKQPITQSLHIDTYNEPIPYRALYAYNPQNEDELELQEGDTVYVMEKCDDGWYVGTSLRTGLFGTFPGNYVERI